MYIPPPYHEDKYEQFTIIFYGRLYICKRYWSVQRTSDGDFVLTIRRRCRK
jgi:hypothetical protein